MTSIGNTQTQDQLRKWSCSLRKYRLTVWSCLILWSNWRPTQIEKATGRQSQLYISKIYPLRSHQNSWPRSARKVGTYQNHQAQGRARGSSGYQTRSPNIKSGRERTNSLMTSRKTSFCRLRSQCSTKKEVQLMLAVTWFNSTRFSIPNRASNPPPAWWILLSTSRPILLH